MRKVYIYTSIDSSVPGEAETIFHMDTTNKFDHVFHNQFRKPEHLIEALDEMLRWEQTSKDLITYEDESLEEFVVINCSRLGPELTTAKYCGECLRDFEQGENVHYTWFENSFFCDKCKVLMDKRCDPKYLDWKLRKVDLQTGV